MVRYQADGSPDPSFGSHGVVRTNFGGPESAEAVAVQPDGKIDVAGWVTTRQQGDMAMARYLPSGDLDPNFSRDGKITVNLSSDDYLSAIAVQRDGRIVAAGASGEGATQFAVVRLRRTGTFDKAFGAGTGIVVTPFPGPASWANAIVIQPDGMLSVAGFAYDGTRFRAALARYTPAGELDAGFGTGGEVTAKLGAGDATVQSIALQPDGRIVVAGGLADDFAVARFTTDGTLDPTFGSNGSVTHRPRRARPGRGIGPAARRPDRGGRIQRRRFAPRFRLGPLPDRVTSGVPRFLNRAARRLVISIVALRSLTFPVRLDRFGGLVLPCPWGPEGKRPLWNEPSRGECVSVFVSRSAQPSPPSWP